jgi:carboxypeptidase Q
MSQATETAEEDVTLSVLARKASEKIERAYTTVDLAVLFRKATMDIDRVYKTLESLCICFPARLTGSETLEKSLDFLMEYGREVLPSDYCTEEPVTCVPCWVRGDWRNEICVLHIQPSADAKPVPFPLDRSLRVLACGSSVGTGPDGVTGEVCLVSSWEELEKLGQDSQLVGKIVLYDYKHFVAYDEHSGFRGRGANAAAKYGAVAVLVRSLAPDSTTSGVHTGGMMPYDEGGIDHAGYAVKAIPSACVAVEDAELISRLAARGHKLSVTLTLPCNTLPDRTSRNLVFEIKGSELPDEIVIIGGHTDCWDSQHGCCQGAHDDGQGVVIALEIVRMLHELGAAPRRTVRAVLFVDEEVRQTGAQAYADAHAAEAHNIVAAIETDLGVGPACGFGFTGKPEAREVLRRLLEPLSALGTAHAVDERWTGKGVDITPLIEQHGVPGLLLRHEDTWWNGEYFHFHHTASDTIDHVDKALLLRNLQVLLGTVWILANSQDTLR